MKVQEFAEVGNSYAQTMDLAARDAHATALPWNPVPSEPKTLLLLTELTDEEYQRGEMLYNDAVISFSEEVAQNLNDVIADIEALGEKYNGLIISGAMSVGSDNADWDRLDEMIRPLFAKYFA